MKLIRKYLFLVVFILLFSSGVQYGYGVENDGGRYAPESKLNKPGNWVKLKVEENAIYKLTYEEIQKMGVNPSKAKVLGYGGWILNEDFRQPYTDDLPEVACWKSGSGDELKPGEYLLFYGRGAVKWHYNTQTKEYVHENNPYSTYGVYFLTDAIDGSLKKMGIAVSPATAGVTLTSFEDYMLHEKEEYSIAKTGRELYGESFSGRNTQVFSFKIPGILQGNENDNSSFVGSSVSLSFASDPKNSRNLTLSVNNSSDQFEELINVRTVTSSDSYTLGIAVERKEVWNKTKNENTKIQVSYPGGGRMGYLNYIRLNMMRKLQYYNTAYTFFRSSENLAKDVRYNIQNSNQNLLVFDVTENYNTQRVQTTFSNGVLSFNTSSGIVREFVLVDPGQSFPVPQKLSYVVDQQNLHGLAQIDMAIISPKAFVSEAERLAEKHRASSGKLNVVVVTPEQIYNEFSSGIPDATAYRRFMKMFYDRGVTNGTNLPRYLLLFGDGMFDNRFLDSSLTPFNKDNFLLTYQTRGSSLSTTATCPSEEYFGFLDEKEEGKSESNKKLMLGIGRFTVQTLASAKSVVDKQIAYMDNKNLGIWKNSVVLLADNSTTNEGDRNSSRMVHLEHMDKIANDVMEKMYPEYMVTKIYLDAFTPEITGAKLTYDGNAKKKLTKSLNDGCLVFNYAGHGGGSGYANNIFTSTDIPKMTYKNLPLWISATCDLAWFDGVPSTAGESIFLNEKSGAVALLTTSRLVYADQNERINIEFMKSLFSKQDGIRPALGDVLRIAKNNYKSSNNLRYYLLGDPALVLNYPEYTIEIDRINDSPVDEAPLTFKALETVKVAGFIKNGASIDGSFNGTINANIFDGIQTVSTLPKVVGDKTVIREFTDYPIRVSSTIGKVENGWFEFTFPVMRDISDMNSLGKMNLYAYDINSGDEAGSSFMNYRIQGTDESADLTDSVSPVIRYMYLNDSTFISGDIVNETPYFIAKITDTLGINISGAAAGHDIQIVIDNSPAKTYSLNDYYKLSETEENTGTIAFSIPELEEGGHTLRFQVWNIMNNVTIGTVNFSVKKGLKPRMSDLIATANPVKIGEKTEFVFSHDRPETTIDVNIFVYDLSGRPVWNHRGTTSSDYTYRTEWDLKTNAGSYVQPGIYLYSATIKSGGGTETTKSKKLVVLGQ